MSLLYFVEGAKLCQLLLKSQMPSESPIEYSSKTLKENANRLQKRLGEIYNSTLFSLVKEKVLIITLIVAHLMTSFHLFSPVKEALLIINISFDIF